MPTYEYQCNACHRQFEIQQRMSDPDLTTCEVCGEDKLEKLISRTAFQLKGSGWYKDLYSSKPAEAMKASVDKGVPPKGDAPAAKADSASAPAAGGSEGGSSSTGSASSGTSAGTPAGTSSGSSSAGKSGGGSSGGGTSPKKANGA